MTYFVVDRQYHVVLDVSSVRHSSPTNYYVAASAEQVQLFHELSKDLPEDTYVELSEVLNAKRPATVTKIKSEQKATPETRKHIADLFKSRQLRGNK